MGQPPADPYRFRPWMWMGVKCGIFLMTYLRLLLRLFFNKPRRSCDEKVYYFV